MNRNQAVQQFAEAMSSETERTKMGRLREVFDLVDSALRSGVKRQAVIQRLQTLGLDLSPTTFRTYVDRLRREQRADPTPAPAPPALSTPQPQLARPHHTPAPPVPTATPAASISPVPTAESKGEAFDIRAIREQTYDLDALRRRWRNRQRATVQAAKTDSQEPPSAVDSP